MKKQQIINALPGLIPAELSEVITAAKALHTMGRGAALPKTEDGSDYLLRGIAEHLIRAGQISASGAVYGLKRRDAYAAYETKLIDIAPFLDMLAKQPDTPGYRYRAQIATLAAEALADWLQSRKIFSVSAMLSQIDKIPEALDAAYPGYVASGLFAFLLTNGGQRADTA